MVGLLLPEGAAMTKTLGISIAILFMVASLALEFVAVPFGWGWMQWPYWLLVIVISIKDVLTLGGRPFTLTGLLITIAGCYPAYAFGLHWS
jgi:hypothetical protein